MEETLLQKVKAWALENRIHPGAAIVAGVSGGADSVCLLHLLHCMMKEYPLSVIAVHINHMLRGDEAIQDEDFVRNLCREWGIPTKVFRKDVRMFSRNRGYSIEEAGRILRYECFHQIREAEHARYIAVAHHSQDQAETIFLNLIRGSGLDGLCGMEPVQGYIIRPLLNVTPIEIETYLKKNGLNYRTDSSNLDHSFIRNIVRNRLFPQIRQDTGRPVISSLLRTARLLRMDRNYLNRVAAEKYDFLVISEGKESVVLNRKALTELDPALSGRVTRLAWEKVTGSRKGLESKHVDAMIQLSSKQGANKTLELPQGVKLYLEYNQMLLSKGKKKPVTVPLNITLPLPCDVKLLNGRVTVMARLYTREEYEINFGKLGKMKESSRVQVFDYDRVVRGINKLSDHRTKDSIVIRNRLPGDQFYPFNSPGKKKLKDFFIDEKIPREKRDNLILLANEQDILWVAGYRTAEHIRITELTQTILYIMITDFNQ